MRAPRETTLYVPAIYVGTGINKPDYLATIDVEPRSRTYGQVLHRLEASDRELRRILRRLGIEDER